MGRLFWFIWNRSKWNHKYIFKREIEGDLTMEDRSGERQCYEEPWTKEWGQPPETRNSKETDSPWEPPETV